MSHGDQLQSLPPDFHVIGRTDTAPFAAVAHDSKPIYGIQFHPEVTHSLRGKEVISRFVLTICGCRTNWTMVMSRSCSLICVLRIGTGRVYWKGDLTDSRDLWAKGTRYRRSQWWSGQHCSGKVDARSDRRQVSTPDIRIVFLSIHCFRFHAIMVDNGVLRLNEAQQVEEMLKQNLGVNLTVVDASELFLSRLDGVEDPEQKRKIIGNTFINVFEAEASKIEAATAAAEESGAEAKGKIEWLLQGTLYPDVIESISFKGPSATIKTHHNVGGLLKDMKLKLIEPLRELFKGQ